MNKIEKYWQNFCLEKNIDPKTSYNADFFGYEEIADELADLIVIGKKTGTSSALKFYEAEGSEIPKADTYMIVLDSKENPVAIIQNTAVEILPFKEVTAVHAQKEGEGDLSLNFWREGHLAFFRPAFEEELGQEFSEDELIVYETFEVVYK